MYRCNIVPRPNQIQPREGFFTIPREGRIEDFVTRMIDTRLSGAESYRLHVRPEGITISAGTPRGLFYAMQSVRQLIATSVGRIPCMCICDEPAYPYRAFMIDCARHFFTVSDLKKMIDAAALFKMNVFHWHLTDDQGWRAEVKKHPELTEIGSMRRSSDFGGIHVAGPYGGAYTQEQMKEIVAYCAERYIEVVPGLTCRAIPRPCWRRIRLSPARAGRFRCKQSKGFLKIFYVQARRRRFVSFLTSWRKCLLYSPPAISISVAMKRRRRGGRPARIVRPECGKRGFQAFKRCRAIL